MRWSEVDAELCQNLNLAIEREWVLTNGLGGYASSTVIGANTSKYHGLLVSALNPPLNRHVLLSKLEDEISVDGKKIALSTNIYENTVFPQGHLNIVNFKLSPFPTTIYLIDESIELEKIVFLIHEKNIVVIKYRLVASERPISLKLSPLIAFRSIHNLTNENSYLNPDLYISGGLASIKPYPELPSIYFRFNSEKTNITGYWNKNIIYPKERDKKLPFMEDLFNPFSVEYALNPEDEAFFIASIDNEDEIDPDEMERKELLRIKKIVESNPVRNSDPDITAALRIASDSFIVKKDSRKTIIAGYPWLSEGISDSMIAIPGLCLETKRFEDAREIILKTMEYYRNGLIPEYFSESKREPVYNSIYPSLFFINTVYLYFKATGDIETVKNPVYFAIKAITDTFTNKKEYNIFENEIGMLCWKDPNKFYRIDNEDGCSDAGMNVDINALWYNALKIQAFFAKELGYNQDAKLLEDRAEKTKKSFNETFVIQGGASLYDTIFQHKKMETLTPYQLFAISLPFPVLDESKWRDIFNRITEKLLTPYGLRTLSPDDINYIPKYEGSLEERASSYYRGSVLPWLLGSYIDAFLKINKRDFAARQKGLRIIKGILDQIGEAGIGTISEVFDGSSPHSAGGCISHSIAVAEILRAYFNLIVI